MKRYPSGILATCCVPWDSEWRLAEATFRRAIRATLIRGTRQIYLFGTAGEGYAVTDAQFEQIVTVFGDEMRQHAAEPMVGVMGLSTGQMLERIERCRGLGVQQFQIALPSWGALNERELFTFFEQTCGTFSDCQFLHYNVPRSKRLVTGQEYGRLAELYPNLVATKNTGDSLSHIRSLLDDAPQLQHFLSESGYVYGSLFGECGILASFVMNWPRLQALWEAGRRRDLNAMVSIQREINVVLQTLFEAVPIGRIDGAYDKLFQKMYDSEFPLRLLPPYTGSSESEFQAFVDLLRQRLPHWLPPSGPQIDSLFAETPC